ncbi:FtsL-like putative cell division protein [Sunxiuqinia sp. sy24]|uniref:FtsL-like putative cell division protein n=1 Tax=Sunxiuqinia sp. sy24 TaxID=3461495 RepID=UPI00404625BB
MSVEELKSGKSKTRRIGLKSFLGGSLLASEKTMQQMPFFFFLAFLGILLISNRYWSEKTIRKMEAVQDSIKELRAESVTYETELMKMNRPSEIVGKIKASGLDLLEPTEPARKLNVEKLDRE